MIIAKIDNIIDTLYNNSLCVFSDVSDSVYLPVVHSNYDDTIVSGNLNSINTYNDRNVYNDLSLFLSHSNDLHNDTMSVNQSKSYITFKDKVELISYNWHTETVSNNELSNFLTLSSIYTCSDQVVDINGELPSELTQNDSFLYIHNHSSVNTGNIGIDDHHGNSLVGESYTNLYTNDIFLSVLHITTDVSSVLSDSSYLYCSSLSLSTNCSYTDVVIHNPVHDDCKLIFSGDAHFTPTLQSGVDDPEVASEDINGGTRGRNKCK